MNIQESIKLRLPRDFVPLYTLNARRTRTRYRELELVSSSKIFDT